MKLKAVGARLAAAPLSRIKVQPKTADAHYLTPEHKAWRKAVMDRAGWRCQHPGCDKRAPEHRLFADHIVEIKDGGAALDPRNGQALCGAHHTTKTAQARLDRYRK